MPFKKWRFIMKKIWLLLISALLISNLTFNNPIMPESLISEVYFDNENNWYLVVDVFLMEILGIQTFQEIEMYSTDGAFVFLDEFLPDFNTYETVITQDALVYPHQLYRETDYISVYWPQGWFDFMYLDWGNSWGDPVKGPSPGQSLVPVPVWEDEFYNVEFWLVKNAYPLILGGGYEITGEFDGFLLDQNLMPLANAELKYVDEYLMNNTYFGYFPPIVTNQAGYFIHEEMLACNYHLYGVEIDGIDYDFDEYVSIEPDSTNTYVFQMVVTGVNNPNLADKPSIYNFPNPFSDFTTFFLQNPVNSGTENLVLKVFDLMGQVVSVQPIILENINNSIARFGWKNQGGLPPGIYCYQLMMDGFTALTGKMTIQ
jgi:hypothetical protein